MKQGIISERRMGEYVKLTPNGKAWKIHTLTRENGKLEIELTNDKGETRRAKYSAIVYYDFQELEQFMAAYIECALWASTDDSTPSGGYPLDRNYTAQNITRKTLARMRADCEKFLTQNQDAIDAAVIQVNYSIERAGHDFWLTRNGHGAGFWDNDLGNAGEILTQAAHAFGEYNLSVYRGKIYGG